MFYVKCFGNFVLYILNSTFNSVLGSAGIVKLFLLLIERCCLNAILMFVVDVNHRGRGEHFDFVKVVDIAGRDTKLHDVSSCSFQ